MRLKQFTASKVYGFKDIEILFHDDITFLTGINGSGKTTVLKSIVALITPSLAFLADLYYSKLSLLVEHEGSQHTITSEKFDQEIRLSCPNFEGAVTFKRFNRDLERTASELDDFEREYYRETLNNHSDSKVLRFIDALPTPMFLGLDRRSALPAEFVRRRSFSQKYNRSSRSLFGSSLSASLIDASILAETKYRDVLIAEGRLTEELRRKILMSLLEADPRASVGVAIKLPSETDRKAVADMRSWLNDLPALLNLPEADVMAVVKPFLQNLENILTVIPKSTKAADLMALLSNSSINKKASAADTKLISNIFKWSSADSQFRRIRKISDVVRDHNKSIESLKTQTSKYLDLVSRFLGDSGKCLKFDEGGYLYVEIQDGQSTQAVSALSSGEAQVFVILTQLLFHPAAQNANILLIDEPEVSLHIQWQEIFVESLETANPGVQYIFATHSPSIILDRINRCVDVAAKPVIKSATSSSEDNPGLAKVRAKRSKYSKRDSSK